MINMPQLQIKTLQQENIILKHQLDAARDALDELRQEKERLIEDIRELRRRLEKYGSTYSKIKAKFSREEIDEAMRHDP
jgi:predicted  nucleic acid-binding Zn-ribbon protein